MSRTLSPVTGKPYGLALVCRVWRLARSGVYRHQSVPPARQRREPLGTAVALRRPDEGGRTLDSEEGDLLLEVVRHVARSMVMPHGEAAGARLAEPTEALPHALPDRLQRLETGSLRMRVDTDTFCGAMIKRDEHRRLTLAGDRRRQIGAPHRVDRVGDDGAVVVARPTW